MMNNNYAAMRSFNNNMRVEMRKAGEERRRTAMVDLTRFKAKVNGLAVVFADSDDAKLNDRLIKAISVKIEDLYESFSKQGNTYAVFYDFCFRNNNFNVGAEWKYDSINCKYKIRVCANYNGKRYTSFTDLLEDLCYCIPISLDEPVEKKNVGTKNDAE